MPTRKGTKLSAMVANFSEDDLVQSDLELMPTPDPQTENRAPARRRVGAKTKVIAAGSSSRVTKAKVPCRRTSGTNLITVAKEGGRKALKELDGVNDNVNGTEDAGNSVEETRPKPAKKGRLVKSQGTTKATKTAARGGPAKPSKRAASIEPATTFIPDTQPEPMQIESTILQEEEEGKNDKPALGHAASSRPAAPALRQARSTSRQTEPLFALRRRAGSASSTERGADPALRRKLGDMTRKLESLDLKYKQLKEVGSSEALTNFEKLRRSTEQRAQDQNNLIAALKKEVAAQKAVAAESHNLHKQLEDDNARLAAEAMSTTKNHQASQREVRDLQNEVKMLTVKLAAVRSSAQPEIPKHTSVSKTANCRSNAAPPILRGEDGTVMKLKEDLYSDLTGLMIRSVKLGNDEDVYDCIQTGRNGTLRFHLFVSHIPPETTTLGANAGYDDTEFGYVPLFDEKNDRELMDILPDYLCEEISFPRAQAAKFYAKIVESMGRKVEFEE